MRQCVTLVFSSATQITFPHALGESFVSPYMTTDIFLCIYHKNLHMNELSPHAAIYCTAKARKSTMSSAIKRACCNKNLKTLFYIQKAFQCKSVSE